MDRNELDAILGNQISDEELLNVTESDVYAIAEIWADDCDYATRDHLDKAIDQLREFKENIHSFKQEAVMKERLVEYTSENRLTCPCCDDELSVLTDLTDGEVEAGMYQDGDSVYCIDKRCEMVEGSITVDEESCYVNAFF